MDSIILNKVRYIFFIFIFLLASTGCKEFGVQGGKVDVSFSGIESIKVISPTSVKVFWTKDSNYLNYNIYLKGNSISIGSSTFSEYIVTGLTPDTNYEFSVSGTGEGDLSEDFQQDFLPTKTYKLFTGVDDSSLSITSATRLDLLWESAGANAAYEVSYKKRSDTDWILSDTISATSSAQVAEAITGLLGGTEYCVRVRANYLDGTFMPADSNQPEVCGTTFTDLVNLPAIYTGSNSPGNFVWFNAVGGDPSYRIEVFNEIDKVNPIVTTNNGDGAFRGSVFLTPAKYDLFAIVRNPATGVQARVELTYSDSTKVDLSVRNFYDDPVFGATHPPLINDGKGVQRLGQQVVSGDFNCDGLQDIAVSAPLASPVENVDLVYETGAVVIYYSFDPPFDNITATDPPPFLKTDITPTANAVFPNPHLIHYPIASQAQLGTKLHTGNFNGDCFYRDGANSLGRSCNFLYSEIHNNTLSFPVEEENIHKCDDLVITTKHSLGEVFAVFGDPLSGIVSGSGGSNFGIDEYTCDSSSSSCRSVKLTSSSDRFFGTDVGSGDFNNDGYDDLIISAEKEVTADDNHNVVYVLRGSNQGITPVGHPSSFATIDTSNTSVFGINSQPELSDNFGHAVSAFYNSRECTKLNTTYKYRDEGPAPGYGYDMSKCDDVVIGAYGRDSNRGSIYTCKAQLPNKNISSTADNEKITGWGCEEHFPTELGADKAKYGYSLLSAPNQNGYPLTDAAIFTPGVNPDVTGALFVGAPARTVSGLSSAGAVYAYYLTPSNDGHNAGGIQELLTNDVNGHAVTADNSIACDSTNASCQNQKLVNSPPQKSAQFGHTISTIEDISGNTGLSYLAVSAPFRNVPRADGNGDILGAGSIFLYNPDISALGSEGGQPVTSPQRGSDSPTCTAECTRYSGGVSPFGPVVIYPENINEDSLFGFGGAVGGDYNADTFGDLIAGAHGYANPIQSNGGIFGFYSNDGVFSTVERQSELVVNENISNELNYRFENAKIIGDVNGDGFDDIITKIEVGTEVTSILYYGSANGLVKSVEPSVTPVGLNPRILFSISDSEMGRSFYKVGSVDCDAFDDIMLVGSRGSYIYYGSSTGIVASAQPSTTPVGKNPQLYGGFSANAESTTINYARLASRVDETGYDRSNQSVGYGDFNDDSCNDIAIGLLATDDFSNVTDSSDIAEIKEPAGDLYNSSSFGRVVVVYGGPSGLQIGRTDGLLLTHTSGGKKGNLVAGEPCSAGVCNPQILASPIGAGKIFGSDLAAIDSIAGKTGEGTSELLISDPNVDGLNGAVYLYEGSGKGLKSTPLQTLKPNIATPENSVNFKSEFFGSQLAYAGDINGDDFPDVIISSPGYNNVKGHAYIFYGGFTNNSYAFVGEANFGTSDFWNANSLDSNEIFATPSQPQPQIVQSLSVGSDDLYANGVAGIGDFNSDGFDDVIVNVALGDYLQEVNLTDAGMAIVYFGSELGLQIDKEESIAPRCIYSDQPEECAPFQLHLPSRIVKERSYLSQSCSGDVNGDGVTDLLMGARGRHHPSGQATATGVFYIMY